VGRHTTNNNPAVYPTRLIFACRCWLGRTISSQLTDGTFPNFPIRKTKIVPSPRFLSFFFFSSSSFVLLSGGLSALSVFFFLSAFFCFPGLSVVSSFFFSCLLFSVPGRQVLPLQERKCRQCEEKRGAGRRLVWRSPPPPNDVHEKGPMCIGSESQQTMTQEKQGGVEMK